MKLKLMFEFTRTLGSTDFNYQKELTLKTRTAIDVMNQFRNTFEDLCTTLDNNVNNVCRFSYADYVLIATSHHQSKMQRKKYLL